MKLTYSRTQHSDRNEISFPLLESWNPLTKVATIAAQVSGRRVLCRISLEVLQEQFCVLPEDPMQAVVHNRPAIRAAARKLIESAAFEGDGSIMIRKVDT